MHGANTDGRDFPPETAASAGSLRTVQGPRRRPELRQPLSFVTSAEGGFTTPRGKPLDMYKAVIFAKLPTYLIAEARLSSFRRERPMYTSRESWQLLLENRKHA